jgi:hypothetical protein
MDMTMFKPPSKLYILFFLALILFSQVALSYMVPVPSDTYPAFSITSWSTQGYTGSTASESCIAAAVLSGGYSTPELGAYHPENNSYDCDFYRNSDHYFMSRSYTYGTTTYSCNYGGTFNFDTNNQPICINAPACLEGELRKPSGECSLPLTCKISESFNPATWACDAPVCDAPQINDEITGACINPPGTECTNNQSPLTSNCVYPKDKGLGIDCPDGTTVYPPMICSSTGSRWDALWPDVAKKPMCSPLATDFTNCQPLLSQRFDQGSDILTSIAGLATVALAAIPELSLAPIAGLIGGVGIEARVLWDGMFHNSAGEIVEVKIQGDVPATTMGDAISQFVKNNPTAPFTSQFPEAYNVRAPHDPIIVEPNSGIIRPVNSPVPLSPNQVASAVRTLSDTLTIPLDQIAPYIQPENIPWVKEALNPLSHDILNQQAPLNYPELTRVMDPPQQSSPYFNIQPNPYLSRPVPISSPSSSPAPIPYPTITFPPEPIIFTPQRPTPIAPMPAPTTLPAPNYNPNPTGTDSPLSSLPPPPPPDQPIDPNAPDLPPSMPEIFPDTWKYFDFLPMANPFSWDVNNFIPDLPESVCYYEIHRTFHVPFLGTKHFDLAPCAPLQPLRAVLAWVFSVLTLFTCFFVIFRSSM